MLFNYVYPPTIDNWVHECLKATILSIHAAIDDGTIARKTGRELVPSRYHDRLGKRLDVTLRGAPAGLPKYLKEYAEHAAKVTPTDRALVVAALHDQDDVAALLQGQGNGTKLGLLPNELQEPISSLYDYGFEALSTTKLRDEFYKKLHGKMKYRICPFCGLVPLDPPRAPREALDHSLPKHLYPFAGANLRNLAPACHKCNSTYKLGKDVLRRTDGVRRKSFDPYSTSAAKVTLSNSQPFAVDGQKPGWVVEFDPDCEECRTWDEIYDIRRRYREHSLEPDYDTRRTTFAQWVADKLVDTPGLDTDSPNAIADLLRRWARILERQGLIDQSFLWTEVFIWMSGHCSNGNDRMVRLTRRIIQEEAAANRIPPTVSGNGP